MLLLLVLEVLICGLILWALADFEVDLTAGIVVGVLLGVAVCLVFGYYIAISMGKREQVGGREGMIGLRGRVVERLNPQGLVKIRGELWTALSQDGDMEKGQEVEVVDMRGLTVVVKKSRGV